MGLSLMRMSGRHGLAWTVARFPQRRRGVACVRGRAPLACAPRNAPRREACTLRQRGHHHRPTPRLPFEWGGRIRGRDPPTNFGVASRGVAKLSKRHASLALARSRGKEGSLDVSRGVANLLGLFALRVRVATSIARGPHDAKRLDTHQERHTRSC